MSERMLPPTLAVLLTAFTSCFQARSYLTFQWLMLGWVQCQGRRTVTEVALAAGAIGARHISVFHRFFSRPCWTLDALGRVVFTLALKWLPADQPLVVLGDDTLARKGGKSIALASMHHDPLLSSARKPFASFGHVWVVLALWAGERTVYLVVDSAYAGRTVLEDRPSTVHVVSRLRFDAALYAPPPRRRPGQKGRPRRRGERLPALSQRIARQRRWTDLPLVLYGRAVTPRILTLDALWYGALRSQLVRMVVVRDPSGRRRDEAFFCTDLDRDAAFILETYSRRWTLEVTFHDAKQHLGFGQAQNQAPQAVERTAPFAGLVYSLVLLWAVAHFQQGGTLSWIVRPWYRAKTAVAFPDLLMALQQELWRTRFSAPPVLARRPQNPAPVPRRSQPRAA